MAETVVVTASEGSFPGLVQALKGTDAVVEVCPLITFTPPPDWAPLDQALERLSSYGAVAVTSPRAAAAITSRIELRGKPEPAQAGVSVWAGGRATADALGEVLGPVQTLTGGANGVAATLAGAMLQAQIVGPVLFACGRTHREELPDILRSNGIVVEEVVCYQSVLATEAAAHAVTARGTIVVVASPSVADLVARACPPKSRADLLAVGPTTASTARAAGWSPVAVALEPTAGAVAAAIRDVIARRSSS